MGISLIFSIFRPSSRQSADLPTTHTLYLIALRQKCATRRITQLLAAGDLEKIEILAWEGLI